MDLAEVIIRFTSDITGFTSGASAVSQALGGMSGEADETSRTFGQKLTHGVSSAYDGFMHFGEGLAHTVESVTEMNFPLMSMVQGLVSSDAEMEQTNIAFTTLLHSSSAAGDYLKQLWNFAAKTPFQFQNLAQASQQMIATGFSAKDTIPDLNAMGNALSAMGKTSPADLMQIVSIFDRMQAGGKVNARDMQELTFMGINGWGMVAKQMGKSVEQVQEMSRKGTLLAKDVVPDLLGGFNKTFGGAMQAQALTFNGLLTTVKDNLQAAWRTISGPLFAAAKGALQAFGNLVASDQFQKFAAGVASAVGGVFTLIGDLGKGIGKIFSGLDLSDVKTAFVDIGATLRDAAKNIQSFAQQAGNLGSAFAPFVKGVQQLLQAGLKELATILWNIYTSLSKVFVEMTKGQGPLGFLKTVFSQIAPTIKNVGDWIQTSLVPGFKAMLPGIQQTAAIFAGQFKEDLKTAGTIFKQIGDWIQTSVAPAIAHLLPGLQQMATAFTKNVLPALGNLMTVGHHIADDVLPLLLPPIEHIITWGLQLAQVIGPILTGAFKILGPIINFVADAIKKLVDFFTKTELGGDILKATLIALSIPVGILGIAFGILAVEAIAGFIMAIPGMIAGFIAGAAGAWTMAAGVIGLTWPILAVIAVIVLIILAIQHWSQILAFIQVVWNAVVAFLVNIWNIITSAIGSFFSALGTKAQQGLAAIGNFFKNLWNGILAGLHNAWNAIVSAVQTALTFLLNIFLAPFRAIGALFSWLYEHNYYFKMLVDRIHAIVFAALAILQAKWNQAIQFIVNLWNTIVKTAENVWNAVSGAIMTVVMAIVNWITTQWNTIIGWLTKVWNTLTGIVTTAWNNVKNAIMKVVLAIGDWEIQQWNKAIKWLTDKWNTISGFAEGVWQKVSGVFSSIWTKYISGPLGTLWNSISGWFKNLATQALQWGQNMITGFLNGVKSTFGSIGTTMGNVMSNIGKFLGFHSPAKEGEGQHIIEWGSGMIKGFSQGVVAAIPTLQTAVNLAMKPVATTLQTQPLQPKSSASASQAGQPVNLYLDGKQFAALMTDHMGNAMLSKLRSSSLPRGALT